MQETIYQCCINCLILPGMQQFVMLKNSNFYVSIANIDNQIGHQALTSDSIDSKIASPSSLATRVSEARSGCGIKPNTFLSVLQIPAILSNEPFGLAAAVILPASSQYLNKTRSLSISDFKTSASAK